MAVVLHAENISKQFPGVRALDNVSIKVHSGEVLGLLGENGAGKSTLLKVLGGVYKPDQGQVVVEGKPTEIEGPRHARELGIAIVHQELKLMHNLSVAENIYMGRLPKTVFRRISYGQLFRNAKQLLDKFGFTINPKTELRHLSIASRQLVEIAKALSTDAKVILMDEPTSSLTTEETEHLFEVISTLKRNGLGIVFISHKLEEIFKCCDRVQV
jgi:ribose transport system ATP-binding protein